MSKVKNLSCYTVYGFMRNELNLSDERLTAYAIVHQFTMWQGAFMNNFEIVTDWLECDRGHAIDVLNSLIFDGLCEAHQIGDKLAIVAKVTRDNY